MKQPSFPGLKASLPLFFLLYFLPESGAQIKPGIDWGSDTVAAAAASSSATKFRSDLNNAGKKATKIISLPVDKLKEILDACTANGVTDVKVLITTIRPDDVEQYSKRNPGLTAAEKKDIVGRQTVILRVPRKAFVSNSGSGFKTSPANPLMISLLAAGMVVLDKAADTAGAEDDIYFGIGTICPPPTSCDN